MKKLLAIISALMLPLGGFADSMTEVSIPLQVCESDGSPCTSPYKVKVANGTLTDNSDGTVTLSNAAGFTTSSGLAGVLSDETGTNLAVFSNSPTLVTPILGAATGTSLTVTGTVSAGPIVSTATADIGWSVQSSTNQACNTTCTSGCVFGFNLTAGVPGTMLACTDNTADVCLCAGAS